MELPTMAVEGIIQLLIILCISALLYKKLESLTYYHRQIGHPLPSTYSANQQ